LDDTCLFFNGSFISFWLNILVIDKRLQGFLVLSSRCLLDLLPFSAFRMSKVAVTNTITTVITIVAAIISFLLFKTPWSFPAIIVAAGIAYQFQQ
jgi:chromate transport protein ChrA